MKNKFLKIFSLALSFGMIFNFAFSLPVFAEGGESTAVISSSYIPKTLEECCSELDKICTREEKYILKHISPNDWDNYLRETYAKPLGGAIVSWLYSDINHEESIYRKSELRETIIFQISHLRMPISDYEITAIILENYSRYLKGEPITKSVEDLWVEHWCMKYPDLKREYVKESLRIGADPCWNSHKHQSVRLNWCTLL